MELEKCLAYRSSIRHYFKKEIDRNQIEEIVKSGLLAPSGKNGQPWKFYIVQQNKPLLKKIAALTAYQNFVSEANCLVCVFLDKTQSYHYVKDCQAIGACIENMLLTATNLKIAACWIGEILNNEDKVRQLLKMPLSMDLMAVLCLGHPESAIQPNGLIKKNLKDCLISYD